MTRKSLSILQIIVLLFAGFAPLFLVPQRTHALSVRDSTQNDGSTSPNITVAAPAGTTVGDVVIVSIHVNGDTTISDNNGGTPFTEDLSDWQPNGDGQTVSIFSRRIQSGDPSTYNFTFVDVGTPRWGIVAVTFQDPDPTTIYDVTPSTTNGDFSNPNAVQCWNSKTITTTTSGSYHVSLAYWDGDSPTTLSTPAGYTAEEVASTMAQAQMWSDKAISPAGATGAQQSCVQVGEDDQAMSLSFAVKAPDAPPRVIRLRGKVQIYGGTRFR